MTAKLETLTTTFKLTEGTNKLRWYPITTTLGFGFVALGLLGYYVYRESAETTSTVVGWQLFIRTSLLFLTVAVIATFLIRTQQKWFQRHADEEFRLKRLELDMIRSTWLAEFAQEWRENTKESVPPELLDRLSRGLYTEGGASEEDIHPLETLLSSLVGRNGSLMMKVPTGGEFKIDRDGAPKGHT